MKPSDFAPQWMRRGACAGVLFALDMGVPVYLAAHLRPRPDVACGETMERILAFVAAMRGEIVWYEPAN